MKSKVIVHIDMDAFFASVEQRDNPNLMGVPVIVGADPKGGKGRGVVSTCSYEARVFGIHSAMPISEAYRRCPHGVFLRGSTKKYRIASQQVFQILSEFTPDVEPIGIDEAFLDISHSFHLHQTPLKTCQKIKERVKQQVNLNASIGIAPVKMVAKIASDYSKPNGLLEITEENMLAFLWKLPIERIWGVGKVTKKHLNEMGITHVGQLAQAKVEDLSHRFGEHGIHLHYLANGIDPRRVEVDDEIKSVSHEHTFEHDTQDLAQIYASLSNLSEKVSHRLRRYELKGRTITLKVRLKGFHTFTRAHTFDGRVNFYDSIFTQAKKLFDGFYKEGMKIRLIGVRVSNFQDAYVQDSLFSNQADEQKEKVHKVVDQIKNKYGERAIQRGYL